MAVIQSQRVVVITGAGISCSSGIPDFRSSSGLYRTAPKGAPRGMNGKDMFDSSVLEKEFTSSIFFQFAADLKSKINTAMPSLTHHFLQMLHTQTKLLRSYTQNIDGLEESVGLKSSASGKFDGSKIIQLHGSLHHLKCHICSSMYKWDQQHTEIYALGQAPTCPDCDRRSSQRQETGQRPLKIGVLIPAITMYNGTNTFGDEIARIQKQDIHSDPDLLLVMGTSLGVHGLKLLLKSFANSIRRRDDSGQGSMKILYINMEPPASEWKTLFDVHVQGLTDDWVQYVLQIWGVDPSLYQGTMSYEGIPIKNYNAYRPPAIPDF